METIEFKGYHGQRIAIVARHIQGVNEDKIGTNIIMQRKNDEIEDYFVVGETFDEAVKKINDFKLDYKN